MTQISILFIPAIITAILVAGLVKKVDIYQLFAQGAKEGLQSAVGIMPNIIAIFLAIDMLTASGGIEFLQGIFSPLLELLKIPPELFPLILMRPVSGSGALVIVENIVKECGTGSFAERAASIMLGSTETVFYTYAVYFAVTSVKYGRHTLEAGMIAYFMSIAATLIILNFNF